MDILTAIQFTGAAFTLVKGGGWLLGKALAHDARTLELEAEREAMKLEHRSSIMSVAMRVRLGELPAAMWLARRGRAQLIGRALTLRVNALPYEFRDVMGPPDGGCGAWLP